MTAFPGEVDAPPQPFSLSTQLLSSTTVILLRAHTKPHLKAPSLIAPILFLWPLFTNGDGKASPAFTDRENLHAFVCCHVRTIL